MFSFKMKGTVPYSWPPCWGCCTGEDVMTVTPVHKIPDKAWPATAIVHGHCSTYKRWWCSAACFVTFCTDVTVSLLAMWQLSAPSTYLRSPETERLFRPCPCIPQLSARPSLETRRTSAGQRHVQARWSERRSSVSTGRHSERCTTCAGLRKDIPTRNNMRWEHRDVQISFLCPVSFVEFYITFFTVACVSLALGLTFFLQGTVMLVHTR